MAGAGIVGGIVGGIAQPIAAHFEGKKQRKFIRQMMKNKHQWEVDDLIAAGLNPILGYTKGGTPIGSPGIANIAGGQASAVMGALKLRSEVDLLQATADRQRVESGKSAAQTKKVEIEVKEFKPTLGGVARRMLNSESAKKFLEGVGRFGTTIPRWVRENVQNAAQRIREFK